MPFFCRIKFRKIQGVKTPVGFHPQRAAGAYDEACSILSDLFKRKFTFYDGRKTAVNLIKRKQKNLGFHVGNSTLCKQMTRNTEKVMENHYLVPDMEDEPFESVEALDLIRQACDMGMTDSYSKLLFFATLSSQHSSLAA